MKTHKAFILMVIKATNVKDTELKATIASFVMVFVLMSSYFILRPVRDAMASDWTDSEVSMLWNLQFFISTIIVSLYGFAVSRIRFRNVVPVVYACFSMSFIAFYLLTQYITDVVIIEKAFYIWVSAFSLFHLSVFWSFMSDTFNKEQGKRLFAIIASGASLGAILGPMLPALFAQELGLDVLMLIAACALFLVVPIVLYIYKLKNSQLKNQSVNANLNHLSGDWFSGFKAVINNRYLLGIALFILLYVFISSFVYFEQKNLLAAYDRTQRAEILASIDWLVNSLTFIMAFFITGRVVSNFGMPITLVSVPFMLVLGFIVLAFAPVVIVILAIQLVRRVGNYAVTRPSREMLFTQVTQEERFKAKPVIDVVLYRGGDAASGSLFALLSEGLGLGLTLIAIIGAVISGLWGWLALFLGRKYESENSIGKDRI